MNKTDIQKYLDDSIDLTEKVVAILEEMPDDERIDKALNLLYDNRHSLYNLDYSVNH